MADIWTLLQAQRRRSGASPLVTYVDDPRGERTELSVTSLENAAAKIANALRDEFELEPGALIAMHLPFHWQRAAWCAGAWTAGAVVAVEGDPGTADLVVAGPLQAPSLVGRSRAPIAVVSLHPFGLPSAEPLPDGTFDVTVAVRQQPDSYLFEPPSGGLDALLLGDGPAWTQERVLAEAAEQAGAWGMQPEGRLLATDALDPVGGWLAALAVPLAMQGSVVLATRGSDLDRCAHAERTTATAGP